MGVYRTEAEQKSAEELFVLFRRIVDMYVLAGSEMEINIETAMRKKVLLVRTNERDPSFVYSPTMKPRDPAHAGTQGVRRVTEGLGGNIGAIDGALAELVGLNPARQTTQHRARVWRDAV